MAKMLELVSDAADQPARIEVLLADSQDAIAPVGVLDLTKERIDVAFGDIFSSITDFARQARDALAAVPVQSAEVEFSVQFSGKGTLYIVSASTQAAIRVKLVIQPDRSPDG